MATIWTYTATIAVYQARAVCCAHCGEKRASDRSYSIWEFIKDHVVESVMSFISPFWNVHPSRGRQAACSAATSMVG